MPDVISGVIIALADTQLTFIVGKVTKKSRTSKEIRENFQEIGTFSLIMASELNKSALFFNKKAPVLTHQGILKRS